jgi:hypothetical protein
VRDFGVSDDVLDTGRARRLRAVPVYPPGRCEYPSSGGIERAVMWSKHGRGAYAAARHALTGPPRAGTLQTRALAQERLL